MRNEDVVLCEQYWMGQALVEVSQIIPKEAAARNPFKVWVPATDEVFWTKASALSRERKETLEERYARQYREAGDIVRETDPDWVSSDDKFMFTANLTHSDERNYLAINTYEWGANREEVVVSKQDALALHAWLTKALSL